MRSLVCYHLCVKTFGATITAGEYSQYGRLSPNREILSKSEDIIHYLCLISGNCLLNPDQSHHKRGSRGGDRGSGPPPLRFVSGGVLWRELMGRGGPIVDFTFLLSFFFWLASLASIIQTYITCLHTSKFNVQYETVILSLYIFVVPLSKLWKESNFPSLAFMKGYFHIFLV